LLWRRRTSVRWRPGTLEDTPWQRASGQSSLVAGGESPTAWTLAEEAQAGYRADGSWNSQVCPSGSTMNT
jgi:hypothetical protein